MAIETIAIRIAGEPDEPLLLHNGLLADRDYEWTRKLAAMTSKRKKTEDDADEIARLEWRGSLYWDPEMGVYLPGDNIRRALLDAARLSKQGKTIERGLIRATRKNRLEYDGPRDPDKMWADPLFRHRAIVKVGTSRVVRTRPVFRNWSTICTLYFDSTVLDPKDLVSIAETAGMFIGIGDGRPFYAGRFNIEVV